MSGCLDVLRLLTADLEDVCCRCGGDLGLELIVGDRDEELVCRWKEGLTFEEEVQNDVGV